jgi:cysteine sulfinate desulfinase/cysteine desulfurase-like protein
MGLSAEMAGAAVRFSLGHETTEQEIDRAGAVVGRVIDRIRSARPEIHTESYAVV